MDIKNASVAPLTLKSLESLQRAVHKVGCGLECPVYNGLTLLRWQHEAQETISHSSALRTMAKIPNECLGKCQAAEGALKTMRTLLVKEHSSGRACL